MDSEACSKDDNEQSRLLAQSGQSALNQDEPRLLINSYTFLLPSLFTVICCSILSLVLFQNRDGIVTSTPHQELHTKSKKDTSTKPHFVFILADDLGWDSVGGVDSDYDLSFAAPTLANLSKLGTSFIPMLYKSIPPIHPLFNLFILFISVLLTCSVT